MINESEVRPLYAALSALAEKQTTPCTTKDLSDYRPKIDLVVSEIVDHGNGRWTAPTAWHAAIFCFYLLANGVGGTPLLRGMGEITDVSGAPAFTFAFRGEGDGSRPLCPNFHRIKPGTSYENAINANRRQHSQALISCFVPILKYYFDKCTERGQGIINWDKHLFVAAAQHYQIPTDLMDWTTDPCVATAFAATSITTEENACNNAVVYILPTFLAIQHGAKFYLPPPFIERLYLQRGFFIAPDSAKADLNLQACCFRIEFPRCQDFQVVREGSPLELMKFDPWLYKLKEWAENWVTQHPGKLLDDEQNVQTLLNKLESIAQDLGTPNYLEPANAADLCQLWLHKVLGMVERFTEIRTSNGLKINPTLLKAIVSNNTNLMESIEKWLRSEGKKLKTAEGNAYRELAELIRVALDS